MRSACSRAQLVQPAILSSAISEKYPLHCAYHLDILADAAAWSNAAASRNKRSSERGESYPLAIGVPHRRLNEHIPVLRPASGPAHMHLADAAIIARSGPSAIRVILADVMSGLQRSEGEHWANLDITPLSEAINGSVLSALIL
jgi:hypothetical protein